MTRISLITTTALAACLALGGTPGTRAADAALTGKVTSIEEGAMEGVVVSAHKEGSTIRISVVTDAQGQFSFPATKLDPGSYKISIRAAGYDLDGIATAHVEAIKTATADLRLTKTLGGHSRRSRDPGLTGPPLADARKAALGWAAHAMLLAANAPL